MTNIAQLPNSDIWFVRAERANVEMIASSMRRFGLGSVRAEGANVNVLAQGFLEQGIVSMGWGIGLVKDDDSRNEILARLEQKYPGGDFKSLMTWVNQIKQFTSQLAVGDAVATVSGRQTQGRLCHIGLIRDLLLPVESFPYYKEYENDHIHRVEWLYQVAQDVLSKYTRRRLRLPPTLHRLSPEASAELRRHCSG